MKKSLLLFLIFRISIIIFAQNSFNDYLEKAKLGNAAAQNRLGLYYEKGQEVTKDYTKAVFWYKKSAEQGHAPAQYNLGNCYLSGNGVSKDYTKAVYWYKKAAEQGHSPSQYNLGCCYQSGWGVQKDYAKAVYWYKKAAEQGNAWAQNNLGYCYQNGWGVQKDYAKAVYWYKKAVEQGNFSAQNNLGSCYYNGWGIQKDYTQAVYWFKKAAEQGNAWAQNNLGYCFREGIGVSQDYTQAVFWYKKAAEQGDVNSQFNLAEYYKIGRGVTQDYKQAVFWYKKAAEQGNILAQANLGYMYHEGLGVLKNYKEAFIWSKKAAEQDEPSAQYNLGMQYEIGEGVEKDNTQAFFWFKKSAEQNHDAAQLKLGTHFLYGIGVDTDLKQAEHWINKAAINGNKDAKASLQVVKYRLKNLGEKPLHNSSFNSVDINIPTTGKKNNNYFAVVIGNEKYQNEAEVPYAENDAKIFVEYLKQTIGIPEKQIKYVSNATLNGLRMAVRWLSQAMEVSGGMGQALFYFSGHGTPDETNKTQYLLPVDGMSSDPESAYSLEKLYGELNKMSAQRITVFLDACFSGATREGKMMASARGVAIKAKPVTLQGNMIAFSAAQGDETSYSFKEQHHGMFTYFLLKKLQETRGDITLGDLADYLQSEVKRQSFADNNKVQTPTVTVSPSINDWKIINLK